LNDILDFSKIEASKLDLDMQPFTLRSVISTTVSLFTIYLREKNLTLKVTIAPDLPELMVGDAGRLRQVLVNLVGNAVKFTEQGGVAISAYREAAEESFCRVRFDIIDTGVGIPEHAREKIFLPFTQVESSHARRSGGSGLGLSISNRLVEMMGGSLSVKSAVGKGSTFSFSVAFRRATEEVCAVALHGANEPDDLSRQAAAEPLTILIVEDNSVNSLVASHLLSKLGHIAAIASSGQDALRMLAAQPFDLVLMDVQMPEMDGYEVTQAIRSGRAGEKNRALPIIAQTASALKGDRERCFAAGMNGHLVKPVYLQDLAAAINRVCAAVKGPAAPGATGSTAQPPILDKKDALARLGGDESIFREVVGMFLDQMPARQKELDGALKASDYTTLTTLAHTLKSSSATVGALSLQSLFISLERAGRSGNGGRATQLVLEIREEFDRYRGAVAVAFA
ncbi:MAG: response regulator, partial [Chitinispirillaceae bacterium]|nr:response regulator [Chitinispirillaceae bacterium]